MRNHHHFVMLVLTYFNHFEKCVITLNHAHIHCAIDEIPVQVLSTAKTTSDKIVIAEFADLHCVLQKIPN